MSTVGVIGAGIAGLTAAYRLHQQGISVRVLEATDRVGGVIRSERTDGYLIEHGPNSIRAASPLLETVLADLGLDDRRVWANEIADTRYVVRDGRPMALPMSLGAFLTTDLFSTRAKLRLLAEPFVGRPSGETDDESVASFTRRRLGPEVLDYAVAPFVGGVFAGDPETLSVRHAFEQLATLEAEHGSLFLGALRRALSGGSDDEDDPPSGLFSFPEGLQTLPNALSASLEDCITRNAPVIALRPKNNAWQVTVDAPERTRALSFDAVICTVPLHRWGGVDFETHVDDTPLTTVPYPPLSVLALGLPREAVGHPLDGFGLLVPPTEDELDILGTIFSSTLFPERAPNGHVLLTTFVGGGGNPALAERPTDELRAVVERDLDRLLDLDAPPTFVRHVQWSHAIPQYVSGYGAVKDTLDALEAEHPRLTFAGNFRRGISVADAMESGDAAARRIASSGKTC